MNTSNQATGRDFGRDERYPYRCIVLCQWEDGLWSVCEIFEWATERGADEAGRESIAAPFGSGVVAMHYYVGEIAR